MGAMLRSLLHGPAPPRVRPGALGSVYAIRHGAAAVSREGEERELAAGRRPRLARAILEDALEAAPPARLVKDYSRFIVPGDAVQTISGAELQAWLDTWRPSIVSVLASNR